MVEIVIKSIFLAFGLAMDACAVSMANGLKDTKIKINKILCISFLFGLFQGVMPLIGYFLGSAILSKMNHIIPFVALLLLSFVGVKMIIEGIKFKKEVVMDDIEKLTFGVIFLQAIATSIDALTVGVGISNYGVDEALITVSIIAMITFVISILGVFIGKKFGANLGDKAQFIGGVILIIIGMEIFIKSLI